MHYKGIFSQTYSRNLAHNILVSKEGKQSYHSGFINSHKEPLAFCQSETISYCIWWPSILTSSGKTFQEGPQGMYH